MARLRLALLGTLHVTRADDSPARLESDKARALLAYLAVEADHPHRRDALLGLLWPDAAEPAARHNLRQALFNLRQAIGDPAAQPPYLLISRDELQFNPASDCELDVAAFSAHLAARAGHAHPRADTCTVCATHLLQALDLYRGRFLHEFFLADSADFEAWAVAQREALHQRALAAAADLAGYYEQHGNLAATRQVALRQLELDPWSEPAHRQLMRAHARDGQRAAALAQYEACRRVLADELGVEPSRETVELYEQIRAGRWTPEARSQRPPLPSNLPAQLTPFVGRERELADLRRLLADPACRCLTLVGPGGIGKTRLALQAAFDHRGDFAQGAAWVQLAALRSVEAVVPAIADALGFSFYGPTDPRLQLFNHLRDSQLLLVLDNVEQLLAAAELFDELLQHASALKLLLTSREPLNVQGEWVFEVEGLQLPAGDEAETIEASAAGALFLQRARRAHAGFSATADDYPAIVRICQLVDGMPLGIELAAAWVRTLTCDEIAREIGRGLGFLTVSARDLPARHRSMRAVFDHSWQLLSEAEQAVLLRLSVFRGGFRREAAEHVAAATLSVLSTLVTKSLIRRSGAGRYDLHELIRQFAAEQFAHRPDEQTAIQARHGRYYLTYLGQADGRLRSSTQRETLAELTAEMDNFRAAWDWATRHHDLVHLCRASATLLYVYELRAWLAEGETVFRGAAEVIQSRAVEIATDDKALTAGHAMRAHSAFFSFRLGKSAEAYAVLRPSATRLQSGTDQLAAMHSLWYLGIVCWELGKFAEAIESLQASLDKARACGESWFEAAAGDFIGIVMHERGEYDQARRHFMAALTIARKLRDPMINAHVLAYMSQTLQALGETAEAEKSLRESLALAQQIGYYAGMGHALDGLGLLAQMTRPDEARALFAASYGVYKESGDLRNLSRVLSHQGYNSLALGDVAGAQNSFLAVLRLVRAGGYVPFALDALAGLALISADDADDERALEFVVHILQHPAATHAARTRAEQLRAELAARLTPQQLEAAQTRARTRSFDQVVDRILAD